MALAMGSGRSDTGRRAASTLDPPETVVFVDPCAAGAGRQAKEFRVSDQGSRSGTGVPSVPQADPLLWRVETRASPHVSIPSVIKSGYRPPIGAPSQLDDLAEAVARITGRPAKLVADLSFSSRAVVGRIALDRGETVIAKRPRERSALDRELTALQLFPPRTRPALVASGEGVFILEDLGNGPSLADLLLGTERRPAEQALYAWAAALGTALAATLRFGAPVERTHAYETLDPLIGLAEDLGTSLPAGLDGDAAAIDAAIAQASPWLAYCPGDTCPDNNRVLGDGSVRLFDFEGAGWRHAATEAAYCRAPFCTCWCVAAMPADILASMEAEFLCALRPPRVDEFRAAIGLAAVFWTLTTFDYFRRFVVDGARMGPPQGPADGRQYVVHRLAAIESERLPALGELAYRLRKAIVARWPAAAELPTFPAFRR